MVHAYATLDLMTAATEDPQAAEPGTALAGVRMRGRAEPATDVAGVRIVIETFRVARVLGSADRSIGGPPRAWLLHKLALTPGTRVADLAETCGLDASTASRHVRNLEDAGLLTRLGDPDDRRAARLSLTQAGQDALDAALQVRGDLVARATAHWPAADQGLLAELLTRLSADLFATAAPDHALVKGTPKT